MNRNKIFESIRLWVLLVSFITSLSCYAWEYPTTTPAELFAGGAGTAEEPYQIATAQQLADLSYLVNQKVDGGKYATACYVVTADIDLESKQWTPISNTTFGSNVVNAQKGTGFKGKFDAQGHRISNMKIDNSTLTGSTNPVAGLFGLLSEGAEIRNVQISGSIISNEPAGGIAGLIYCSSKTATPVVIEGCLSSMEISEGGKTSGDFSGNAGGILGEAYMGTVYVLSCGFTGTMTRTGTESRLNAIVGLAGQSDNDNRIKLTMSNCYNTTSSIPGSTNNTNSWKFGNMIYYRSNTNVVDLTQNNYSACFQDGIIFESNKMQKYEAEKAKSYEIVWELNNSQYELKDGGLIGASSPYWSCDDATGQPIPICYNPGAYKPVYRVTIIPTHNKQNVTYLYSNSQGKISQDKLSPTSEYFSDEELKTKIPSLSDKVFDGDCTIYEVEEMVADLKYESSNNTLTVEMAHKGNPISTTVEINGTTYKFSFQWFLNGKQISGAIGQSYSVEGEGIYNVKVISEPSGYNWILSYAKGKNRVYCDPKSGNSTEDGTKKNPYKTLTKAYQSLLTAEQGGTVDNQVIYVMSDIPLNTEGFISNSKYVVFTKGGCDDKPVTITAKDDEEDFKVGDRYASLDFNGCTSNNACYLTGDLKLENIALYSSASVGTTAYLVCQGWNLTIGKGVKVLNFKDCSGTGDVGIALFGLSQNGDYASAPDFHIVSGYYDLNQNTSDGTLKYPHDTCKVLIQSGRFVRVLGGSRVSSDVVPNIKNYDSTLGDPLHLFTVDIVVDIEESQDENRLDINQITGGQTDGNCYIASHITVKNGKVGRIVGGNLSYARVQSSDNAPRNSYYGKVQIDIDGGTVHALYGQGLGRASTQVKPWTWFYGKTIINIRGEKTVVGVSPEIAKGSTNVTGIYGGSSNGQAGYDEKSTDVNKQLGKTFMEKMGWDATEIVFNIEDGTFYQPIFGAGYGYSEYVNDNFCDDDSGCINGNVYLNINGGTFKDNVYGAARGTDVYQNHPALAQVKGNVVVNILGGTFEKNIFGGSLGYTEYPEMAKVTGNIYLNVKGSKTQVKGNVYGGGQNAKVVGDTRVYLGGQMD